MRRITARCSRVAWPCSGPPDRLSAIRTSGGDALDGASSSFGSIADVPAPLLCAEGRSTLGCLLAGAFSTPYKPRDTASDALCRSARAPAVRRVASRSQDRFHRARVNRNGFHSPGRLPSMSAPSGPALAGTFGHPPPFSRLCHLEPASDALSPLRVEGLDLPLDDGLLTRSRNRPHVAHRLLQSSAVHEHNREIDRTSFWQPERLPSSVASGLAPPVAGQGQPRSSRLRGRQPLSREAGAFLRDRSRGKLHPNPIRSDTSCRKPVPMPGWRTLHQSTHRVG